MVRAMGAALAAAAAVAARVAAEAGEETARATRRTEALILVNKVSGELKTRITDDLSEIRKLREQIAARQSQRRRIAGFSLPEVKELSAITEQIEKLEAVADRMELEIRRAVLSELKAAIDPRLSDEEAGDLLLHIASFAHLPELPKEDLLRAAILSGDADSVDRIIREVSFRWPEGLMDLARGSGDEQIIWVLDKYRQEVEDNFYREFPDKYNFLSDSETGN